MYGEMRVDDGPSIYLLIYLEAELRAMYAADVCYKVYPRHQTCTSDGSSE